ncbi:molybdenum cofactor guanylyltransferase MobA [Denitromonas iodatirespirans]|uniref:Molybdenum cofactor guanylyltransferase n=1 Tax=Denitromonas iodatirespirans TaxID=2795389 RepID=A0A944D4W5_DENI1|nr:molybdenum cofactor guanylyltransferase MobA [Denitromonas iodatirespirans]MBT0959900.1 molybdenum cofactor guanylyltransferase [Denitromonas iodatirespirans]
MSHTRVTGLVLAGGLGRRMGGADKGLIMLDGRPMIDHVLARLQPQVDELLINANRNTDTYARFGIPVLADRHSGFVGPLAGLDAGLAHLGEADGWVVTCPCDSPFVPPDLVARLMAAAHEAEADVAIARAEGQLQPVFLLAHTRTAGALRAYLAAGERKIDRWVFTQAHAIADFDDCPEAFANINTIDELARHGQPPA